MSDNNPKIWRIVDLLEWSKEYLHKKGVESPQIEAEMMLRQILNLSRIEIYLNHDQIVEPGERQKLKDYLLKRGSGIPIQYILGYTEFMGYRIEVSPDTLIPRHDTEVIIDNIWEEFDKDLEIEIIDLCTGSGCIVAALALHFEKSQADALDISQSALKIATKNFKYHNISDRVKTIQQDLTQDQRLPKQYDLIISNPPYISGEMYNQLDSLVKDNEPYIALNPGADELLFYKIIAEMTQSYLKPDGSLYVEIGGNYQVKDITNIFVGKGLQNLEIIKDYNGISRGIKATNGKKTQSIS